MSQQVWQDKDPSLLNGPEFDFDTFQNLSLWTLVKK
jgi:hypothetical protein